MYWISVKFNNKMFRSIENLELYFLNKLFEIKYKVIILVKFYNNWVLSIIIYLCLKNKI